MEFPPVSYSGGAVTVAVDVSTPAEVSEPAPPSVVAESARKLSEDELWEKYLAPKNHRKVAYGHNGKLLFDQAAEDYIARMRFLMSPRRHVAPPRAGVGRGPCRAPRRRASGSPGRRRATRAGPPRRSEDDPPQGRDQRMSVVVIVSAGQFGMI